MTELTLRMLGSGLSLCAAVCARSVLEHHAVSTWLNTIASNSLDRFIRRLSVDELERFEKNLARCLGGTKGTEESVANWKSVWDELFGPQSVNLMKCVESLSSYQIDQYHYLSSVVHGFAITGGDLLGGDSAEGVRQRVNLAAAVVLSDCIDCSVMRNPTLQSIKLEWLATQLAGDVDAGDAGRKMQYPGKLKPGRDVNGKGTEEEPYQFRDGLQYHEAFYTYLEQKGIPPTRQIWVDSDGRVGDKVLNDDGMTLYFLH